MKPLAILACALLPVIAICEEEYTEEEAKVTTEMVNSFSSCAGFYEFMAQFSESQKQPASAKSLRDYARGAETAAAYLLSIESAAKGKARGLTEFSDYVQGRKEANLNRLHAMAEQNDGDGLASESERCRGLLQTQEEILQLLRNQVSGR